MSINQQIHASRVRLVGLDCPGFGTHSPAQIMLDWRYLLSICPEIAKHFQTG